MARTSGHDPDQVSGLRKAAVLMVMNWAEASSKVLRSLDEEEVTNISREIARLQALSAEDAEGILEEFIKCRWPTITSCEAVSTTQGKCWSTPTVRSTRNACWTAC